MKIPETTIPKPLISRRFLPGLVLMVFAILPHGSYGETESGNRFDNYRDWAIYRGDNKANQYSELNQIHAGNVHQLQVTWEYHHGDANGPSMYSNPIMVDGLLYFTTPRVNAVALNAATGKEVWVFEPSRHNRGNSADLLTGKMQKAIMEESLTL